MYRFFLIATINWYVTSVGFSIIWYNPLKLGFNLFETLFSFEKVGIGSKTSILRSDAVVKREFSSDWMFCPCKKFFAIFR